MALQKTIQGLIAASAITGQVKEIHLARGLIVSISVLPQKTQLRLWRTTVRPSLAEWRTILNAWPYPVRLDEPADVDERELLGLSGSWPTPASQLPNSVQLNFMDEEANH